MFSCVIKFVVKEAWLYDVKSSAMFLSCGNFSKPSKSSVFVSIFSSDNFSSSSKYLTISLISMPSKCLIVFCKLFSKPVRSSSFCCKLADCVFLYAK